MSKFFRCRNFLVNSIAEKEIIFCLGHPLRLRFSSEELHCPEPFSNKCLFVSFNRRWTQSLKTTSQTGQVYKFSKLFQSTNVIFLLQIITLYRDDPDLQNFIDFVQQEFNCCGLSSGGFLDWSKNEYFNCSSPSVERCGVPYSCCINSTDISSGLINIMCGYGVQCKTKISDLY